MEAPWARLEEKIDGLGTRLDGVDSRLDTVDKRLESVDKRFDAVDKRFDAVDKRFDDVDAQLGSLDGRVASLEGKVTTLAAEVHKQGLLLEASDNSIKLVAERTLGLRQSVDLGFIDVMKRLDERVQPVEAASRYLASQLPAAKRRRK